MKSPEEVWRKWDDMEARLSAPLSARLLELGRVASGMQVLDLATGRGEPAIAAAKRVGPGGRVLGIDKIEGLLGIARERAAREDVENLELRVMDATALSGLPSGHFDVALCRWALMYFSDPLAALEGVRVALKPGGVFVAAVWAEPSRVPYFTLPRRVLERCQGGRDALAPRQARGERGDASVPGVFRYAEPSSLPRDLERAGFRVEHTEELDVPVMEARTSAELLAWTRDFGLNSLLEGLPESTQRAWEEDFLREAEAHREEGAIRLGGITRLVVASRVRE